GSTCIKNSEAVPGGPTCKVLSELAKRHHCYVCAGLYEYHGGPIYNTAVLYDRDGKFVGKYNKTHLPREESEAGLTPGDTYPVFDTDFGKVGIMICWDVHFPEPARSLALQGAELILLPIWGGNETLTRARAIENHVYLISSSYHMKNMILDPMGNSLAEAPGNGVGLITAEIPLGKQIIQPWLSDMKNRIWGERRGDIAWRIADHARSRDVTPTAEEKPIPYTLTEGHPRVYVNAAELPELRLRARTTSKAEFDSLLAYYENNVNKLDGGGEISALGVGGDYVDFITKFALLYLLTGDKAHADACIRSVEKLLLIDVEGTYVATQRRVRALGVAYDWCHEHMSVNFRRRVAKQIEAYVQAAIDSGEATLESGYLAGHVANMVPHFLAAGIAIGDEGNGSWLINQCLRWTERFLANSKFFLEGHSYQQSYPYTCAYVAEIAALFRLMEAGLGQTPHKVHPWFQNAVNWWLYSLRSDQTYIRYGDYFCSMALFDNGSYYRPMAYIANRYNDPHARWFAEQFKLSGKDEFHLLLYPAAGPDSLPAKAPTDLPRTSYHEKMGIVIARGDWAIGSDSDPNSGGSVAAFKCSPHYLHNHCHRDANSITLYHKGDLALDSGAYDGYETPQWYNYYVRTIAHNSIVVYDPDECFVSRNRPQANDGGQRFINEPRWSPGDYNEFLQGNYKDGSIIEQWQKADHSYVCGDASNCYSPAKLKKFLRHVTFVLDYPHKGAVSMLVLDEIELNKDGLEPKFLLHATDEIQTDGNTATITQGGGRLTANFLTPVSIEKIGGPGKEWWVDGKNYAPIQEMKGRHTPGAWRIEAAAKATSGRTFQILTLLTPTDMSAPVPPSPKLEQTAGAWIVKQGSLTVALYRNTAPTNLSGERQILVKLANS
ncbi:MAG: heparinase II/III family protein, partial [Phycisphaerales bacterium]|nr:heparinase II/III family protein [Phycisphaerales bacterium]